MNDEKKTIDSALETIQAQDTAITSDTALIQAAQAVKGLIKGRKVIVPFVDRLTSHFFQLGKDASPKTFDELKDYVKRVLSLVDCPASPPEDYKGEEAKAYRNRYGYVINAATALIAPKLGLKAPAKRIPDFDAEKVLAALQGKYKDTFDLVALYDAIALAIETAEDTTSDDPTNG